MKNVCILSNHYFPIKSSCSSLIRDLIKSLLKRKIKVTLITLSGYSKKIKKIKFHNFTYVGIKTNYIRSPNNYLKAINEIFSILKLRFYFKNNVKEFYDDVIVYSPTIFWSLTLPVIKKKNVSIILRDLTPKWLLDHKIIKKFSLNFIILKLFELYLYKQSNNVYVQTPKDLNYIKSYSIKYNFKTSVLYNWIELEKSVNKIYSRPINSRLRFIFTGVIGIAQDYKILSNIIEFFISKNIKSTFIFIGEGSKKKSLKKLVSSYKFVFFLNEMKINKLENWIKKSDICLCTLDKKYDSDNFPGKILRYMKFNKTILVHAPNNDFLKDLIENNNLGLYSSNKSELYCNLEKLINDKKIIEKLGSSGYQVLEKNFSTKNIINFMI